MSPTDDSKKIVDVGAPTITKHPSGMAQNSQDAEASPEESQAIISNSGTTITPPTLTAEDTSTDLVPATPDATSEVESVKPAAPYEATDSLPDSIAISATQATDAMQAPKIYDTKEYMVPIHDTMHGHGLMGKIIAALVSVALLLAVLYVVLVVVL